MPGSGESKQPMTVLARIVRTIGRCIDFALLGVVALLAAGYATYWVEPGGWMGMPGTSAIDKAKAARRETGELGADLRDFSERLIRVGLCELMVNHHARRSQGWGPVIETFYYDTNQVEPRQRSGTIVWTNRYTGRNTCGAVIGEIPVPGAPGLFGKLVAERFVEIGHRAAEACILGTPEMANDSQRLAQAMDDVLATLKPGAGLRQAMPVVVAPEDIDGAVTRADAVSGGAYSSCLAAIEKSRRERAPAGR